MPRLFSSPWQLLFIFILVFCHLNCLRPPPRGAAKRRPRRILLWLIPSAELDYVNVELTTWPQAMCEIREIRVSHASHSHATAIKSHPLQQEKRPVCCSPVNGGCVFGLHRWENFRRFQMWCSLSASASYPDNFPWVSRLLAGYPHSGSSWPWPPDSILTPVQFVSSQDTKTLIKFNCM